MYKIISIIFVFLVLIGLSITPFSYNYFYKPAPLSSISPEFNAKAPGIIYAQQIMPQIQKDINTAKNLKIDRIVFRPYFNGLEGYDRLDTIKFVEDELQRLGYLKTCDGAEIIVSPKIWQYPSFWISIILLTLIIGSFFCGWPSRNRRI